MNHLSLCVALMLCGGAVGWSWGETLADGQAPRGMLTPEEELWYGSSTNPIPGLETVRQVSLEDFWAEHIQELMSLLGVGDGSTNDVCRSWEAPGEISVGQDRYDVRIANGGGFTVTLSGASNEAARCYVVQYANARSARRMEFGGWLGWKVVTPVSDPNRKPWEVQSRLCPSSSGRSDPRSAARFTVVVNVDSATNALYVTSKDGLEKFDALVYKNLVLSISAPTNALEIAVALMNAGLPEDERITR